MNPAFFSTGRISASISHNACDAQARPKPVRDTSAIEVDGFDVVVSTVLVAAAAASPDIGEFRAGNKLSAFAVDCNLTLTRLRIRGHSGLTTTYGVYNFHNSYLISFNLMVFGFCAACGCSEPAYTFRF